MATFEQLIEPLKPGKLYICTRELEGGRTWPVLEGHVKDNVYKKIMFSHGDIILFIKMEKLLFGKYIHEFDLHFLYKEQYVVVPFRRGLADRSPAIQGQEREIQYSCLFERQ